MKGIVHSSIYKTKEYNQFLIDSEYNRDVNTNHVKKLKDSIKTFGDYGDCFPIVVDENMRIVDGQHRFTARKELGLTIYYIQSTELDSTKLGGINDSVNKWKPDVYLKVSKSSVFVKWISERLIPHLPDKIKTLGTLLKLFGISKKLLLTANEENTTYKNLVLRTSFFITYCKILEKNMTDWEEGSVQIFYKLSLALKLVKFKVPENEVIKGTYAEIMVYLYQNNLVK